MEKCLTESCWSPFEFLQLIAIDEGQPCDDGCTSVTSNIDFFFVDVSHDKLPRVH
jgi:hypothetical protein